MSYTWTGIYRRSFIEENNIRHNTTPGASFQDIGFFWKTTVKAKRVMLINKPYYWYRQDNPNQSIKKGDKVYFRDQEFDRVKEFLANNDDTGLWEKFRNYYYAGRFRRSLVNIKRISDEFTGEYLDHIRSYFSEAVESGDFEVMIGSSSRDIKLSSVIHVESDDRMPFVCTPNTTMGDIFALENGSKYLEKLIGSFSETLSNESDNNDMGEATRLMMEAQLRDNPLRVMVSFSDGKFSHEDIEEICNKINEDLKNK